MNRFRDEMGQTTLLVLGLAVVAFAVVGLAVDGTRAFLMRRTLQNAADAAALAGSGEIDEVTYYSSGGRRVEINPEAAQRRATEWLRVRGVHGRAAIEATREGVRVVLRDATPTSFLRLVGIGQIPVAAEADAAPVAGSP